MNKISKEEALNSLETLKIHPSHIDAKKVEDYINQPQPIQSKEIEEALEEFYKMAKMNDETWRIDAQGNYDKLTSIYNLIKSTLTNQAQVIEEMKQVFKNSTKIYDHAECIEMLNKINSILERGNKE